VGVFLFKWYLYDMKFVITESERQHIRLLHEQESPTKIPLTPSNLSKLDNRTKDTINQSILSDDRLVQSLINNFNQKAIGDPLNFLVSHGVEPYILVRGNENLGEKVVRTGIYFQLGQTPFGVNLNLGDNPLDILGRLDDTRIGVRLPLN
jgi:hypothetical protein